MNLVLHILHNYSEVYTRLAYDYILNSLVYNQPPDERADNELQGCTLYTYQFSLNRVSN